MKMQSMKLMAAALMLAAAPAVKAEDYKIDAAHSRASFSVRHLMVSNVRGEFSKVEGTISYDDKNPASLKVSATIDPATISTSEPKRDAHLKSPDFFDVAKFPTMSFVSKRATKSAKGLAVVGDLTLHGVTKEVTLDVEPTAEIKDPYGLFRRGAVATTKINRKDFGLTWNAVLETGGVAVGEEVSITIDIEAVRPAPKK